MLRRFGGSLGLGWYLHSGEAFSVDMVPLHMCQVTGVLMAIMKLVYTTEYVRVSVAQDVYGLCEVMFPFLLSGVGLFPNIMEFRGLHC
jgi:hypothetical protein